jgi:hypothetical protein
MSHATIIEKMPNNYSAHVPDLPGCVATGSTIEEISAEIQAAISFHLTPICSGEPYSFLKNVMDSYHTNNMNMMTRLSQHQINPHINLISGYDQIISGDLTFINFIYPPSDFGGWIIVQQRQEYEYPVLVAYTEMTSNSLTFVGHRPLTVEEWLFFEKWERQILGIDREIKDYLATKNTRNQ